MGIGFVVYDTTGVGGITKVGDGALTFWGTRTQTFTGPLRVKRGSVFLTQGAKLTTTNIVMRNLLMFQNTAVVAAGSQQQFGEVLLMDGLALFSVNSFTAATVPARVTIDTLSRPHHAPMAFALSKDYVTWGTSGFGTAAGQAAISFGNYDASWQVGGILPFALIGNVNSSYSHPDTIYAPAAYDAGGFVKPATVTNLTQLSDAMAGQNVKISPIDDFSVTSGMLVDMNALMIASVGPSIVEIGASGNAGTVRLASGQLLYSPTSNYRTDTRVTFDMNGQQAYVFATQAGGFEMAGRITNASGFTYSGYPGGGYTYLGGVNLWTGATTVASGQLSLGPADAIPPNTRVNIASGAILDGPWNVPVFGSLAGSGALKIENGQIVGTDNSSTTFDGQIYQNNVSYLTKQGMGTLTLGGTNYYTGVTTVSGGGLVIDGALVASANGVTVHASAFLAGTGTIARDVTVNSGGLLTAGLTNSVGTLNISSNLNLKSGAILDVQLGAGQADRMVVGNGVNLNSDSGAGSTLRLRAVGPIQGGEQYTIINKPSVGAVQGTFANADALAVNGYKLTVAYDGGGGDDVVLTVLPQGTVISVR